MERKRKERERERKNKDKDGEIEHESRICNKGGGDVAIQWDGRIDGGKGDGEKISEREEK